MFKKIYSLIDNLKDFIRSNMGSLSSRCFEIHTDVKNIKAKTADISKFADMEKTIASQQRTIEALTNALQDKYEKGLFVYSEDCKVIKVIRNGKALTNPYVRSLRVDWALDCAPEIIIDEFAGTFGDEEK